MRASNKKLNASLNKQILDIFEQTIADLKTPKDAKTFLKDFMKDKEIEMFAKRLAIAYWLSKGRSYQNIKNNLQVSSATIAAVQNSLETPGMKLALKNIEAEEWAGKWAARFKKITGK